MIKKLISLSLVVSIFALHGVGIVTSATLTNGSVTLSDSRPTTASVSYTIDFNNVTTSTTRCIRVQFSDAATGGSKPAGMTITGAALSGSSDYIPTPASWTVNNNNTTGVSSITLAGGETPASATGRTVILTGITNGSTAGTTYYVQFSTYSNTDCTTGPIDNAVIAYIYTDGQSMSASVDPTLTFSVNSVGSGQSVNGSTTTAASTSTTIPLGTLSVGSNRIVAQDLTVGTNAQNGYTVTIAYTGQMTNGSHNMTNHSGTNGSPTSFSAAGTEAVGYTTNDTTLGTGTAGRFGGGNWAALSTTPAEVAYSSAAVSETTRTGFQAGISATTPAGAYTTTVVYTATATY
jgi:hypothetical protein